MPRYKPMEQRFREKYVIDNSTECWNWQGALVGIGYGHLNGERGSKSQVAHRYSYELHVGKIPDGMIVCHKCDNPSCVNPEHLYVADHATNMREMKAKGRARLLSADEVAKCKQELATGKSFTAIARDLGVSRPTVQRAMEADHNGDTAPKEGRKGSKYYTILGDDDRNAVKAALRDESLSIMKIAKMFNIDRRTVRNIRDGKSTGELNTKISKTQVEEIISYWQHGFRQQEIADTFGISQTYVSRIVRGVSWNGLRSTRYAVKRTPK